MPIFKRSKGNQQPSQDEEPEKILATGSSCAVDGCFSLAASRNAFLCKDHGLEYRRAVRAGNGERWLKERT